MENSENTVNSESTEETVSPEVQDYLAHPESTGDTQPDKSEIAPDHKEATETEPDTTAEETTNEETVTTEDGAEDTTEETTEETAEDLNPKNQTYKVAGKEYKSFDDAVVAVNKIAGENGRQHGEIESLRQQVQENERKYQEALDANIAWQKHFEGNGDKPAVPAPQDIEAAVDKILQKRETDKSDAQLREQYTAEVNELPKELDYATVYPKLMELANKLGDNIKKISPKELYLAARGLVSGSKPLTKVVEDTKEKMAKKTIAAKVMGGSKQRASATVHEDVSPEIADYFEQR